VDNGETTRRGFLCTAALGVAACAAGCALGLPWAAMAETGDSQFIQEAQFYEKQPEKRIKCKLCPRECVIDDRERGYCGARENRGGTYYTLVHSRVASAHIDPIEKKPLFHFRPGSLAFSIATAGCNVNCKFCQNWEISQVRPEQVRSEYAPPQTIAELARKNSCGAIAYTYSEPVIFTEYVLDCAQAGRALNVPSVVVTNGYIQETPLKRVCASVDAIKVDLKSFSETYYKEVVNGELKPVLNSLAIMRHAGMWVEIVYLVVPTRNDGDAEFRDLSRWIKQNLGSDVPIHFTRFHPEYLLKNLPPTPVETLERAKKIADAEGLHYVYIGNVPGHPAENTYCPKCRHAVVERAGFTVTQNRLNKGKCPDCQTAIPGIWS
jgi:pyruvate formate lyase activating enzyme